LARWARPQRFDLAIAHGSVDLATVGTVLRIPQAQMQDYEYAGLQRKLAWKAARRVIVPDAIPIDRLEAAGARAGKLIRYPGLKEDYYLSDFTPDPAVLAVLGLDGLGIRPDRDGDDRVLVVVRPPPETSAYHAENPLYERVIDRLCADPRAITVLIPRTDGQRNAAIGRDDPSLLVPATAIDAQSLIAYSDLVVSAGGTMNREAVALGVPVWTIFSGRMGAVDERLIAAGRLRELRNADALELAKRTGKDIHMLADDTDDPYSRSLEYLAVRTIEESYGGRVTASHCGALAAYDDNHAARVIGYVKEAGVSISSNAQISLVLDGRADRGLIRRGITRVRELLDAGVNVLSAQDDVNDPYYPFGQPDQIEVGQYTAHVAQLTYLPELETVFDMITVNAARAMRLEGYGVDAGDRADLCVIDAPTVREALRLVPPRRLVFYGGRLVAESRLERTFHA